MFDSLPGDCSYHMQFMGVMFSGLEDETRRLDAHCAFAFTLGPSCMWRKRSIWITVYCLRCAHLINSCYSERHFVHMRYLFYRVVDTCMGKWLRALNLIHVSPKCLRIRLIVLIQYGSLLRRHEWRYYQTDFVDEIGGMTFTRELPPHHALTLPRGVCRSLYPVTNEVFWFEVPTHCRSKGLSL
jgi:hypothetical protein